jgi:hypothetical protein
MLNEILQRNVSNMNSYEMEEECRELEDAYAEALKDNAGFEALGQIWKRIRELQSQLRENSRGHK